MINRTLYKTGNSIVVAIPSYMLERAGLAAGSVVELDQGSKSNLIWFKKSDPNSHNRIKPLSRSGSPP